MNRTRLFAAVTTFGIVVLWAGTAFAGTITTPSTSPFNVPLNAGGTAPAPFKISVAGYVPSSSVFVMICDGTDPKTKDWDPNINCDNGTSPQQQPVAADGTATWDPNNPIPQLGRNQSIVVFDGEGPGGVFNCFSPGELDGGVAYSNGPIDPSDGLPSWTNCQIRTASNNAAVTTDQAFATMVLPVIGAPPPVTTTTAPGSTSTTSTTVPATTVPSTTVPPTTVPPTTTTISPTTTTTEPPATTTTTGDTTTTSTTVGDGGTTTTTVARSTTSNGSGSTTTDATGLLAVTGVGADGLVVIALCLITAGFIVKSRGRA